MTQRRFPVSEVLQQDPASTGALMFSSKYLDAGRLVFPLPDSITHGRARYTHASVAAISASAFGEMLDFSASSLAIKLQPGPNAEHGLVTELGFASFMLSKSHMDQPDVVRTLTGLLLPQTFRSYHGSEWGPSERTGIHAGVVGAESDSGVYANIAARSIGAAHAFVHRVGSQALRDLYEY